MEFAADGDINFAYNIDDITTATDPVPEPASFTLLAMGLLLGGALVRRRSGKK